MTPRRKRGTGTITFRDGGFVALAPQFGGRGNAKQLRVAKCPTRSAAARELDAWLKRSGRIVWKGTP
jgi:hypothetical protein